MPINKLIYFIIILELVSLSIFFVGKYYRVDSGYPQQPGYMAPYRGQQYHIPDFQRGERPRGIKEVFNHAHSSLKCTIERTFRVLKKMVEYTEKYEKLSLSHTSGYHSSINGDPQFY